MHYLSKHNFIHRDLAARNCMIDSNFTIKVADFGLSKDMNYADIYQVQEYHRVYRMNPKNPIELAIKWLAPECILFQKFSERSDVWSYGVTIWEIMSAGQAPYPTLHPNHVIDFLRKGHRLELPENCVKGLYDHVMQACWQFEVDKRIRFRAILDRLKRVYPQLKFAEPLPLTDSVRSSQHLNGSQKSPEIPMRKSSFMQATPSTSPNKSGTFRYGSAIGQKFSTNTFNEQDYPAPNRQNSVRSHDSQRMLIENHEMQILMKKIFN